MGKESSWDILYQIDKELILLEQTSALLEWDEETQMPPDGIEGRSEQISLIKGYIHDLKSSEKMGKALREIEANDLASTDAQKALIRIYRKEYDDAVKIPKTLVLELSDAESKGQNAWVFARKNNDFSEFEPYLKKIIDLKRSFANTVGYEEHPYNALLNHYEPGMTVAKIDKLFIPLKREVVALMEAIRGCTQIDDSFLYKDYPKDKQDHFGRGILHDMGFDFRRAQMCEAVHPFTTTVGYDDIRITTRYDEPSVSSPLFSTIHEGGHGLYELGASNSKTRGTALGQGVSMAIHESQSRLWENIIGRSEEFWDHYFPIMSEYFPEQLEDISKENFFRGVNKVEPSFIRVNADEVTYNLHIIMRYELEKQLIAGSLAVKDLPAAWNALSEEFLGIVPEGPQNGVLQDIHWAAGLIGYFPTYALGNLYGAQIYHELLSQVPETRKQFSEGNLNDASLWLNREIYLKGSIYTPEELLKRVTGEELDSSYFIDYLWSKYKAIYRW